MTKILFVLIGAILLSACGTSRNRSAKRFSVPLFIVTNTATSVGSQRRAIAERELCIQEIERQRAEHNRQLAAHQGAVARYPRTELLGNSSIATFSYEAAPWYPYGTYSYQNYYYGEDWPMAFSYSLPYRYYPWNGFVGSWSYRASPAVGKGPTVAIPPASWRYAQPATTGSGPTFTVPNGSWNYNSPPSVSRGPVISPSNGSWGYTTPPVTGKGPIISPPHNNWNYRPPR